MVLGAWLEGRGAVQERETEREVNLVTRGREGGEFGALKELLRKTDSVQKLVQSNLITTFP